MRADHDARYAAALAAVERDTQRLEVLHEHLKRCPKCLAHHPRTVVYWYADPRRSDGLSGYCRPCAAAYLREQYQRRKAAHTVRPPDLGLSRHCACHALFWHGLDHLGRTVDVCPKCGTQRIITRHAA